MMIFRWAKTLAISSVAVPVTLFKVVCLPTQLTNLVETKSRLTTTIVSSTTIKNETTTEGYAELSLQQETIPLNTKDTQLSILKHPGQCVELTHGYTHYFLEGPKEGKLVCMLHGISVFSFIWKKLSQLFVQNGYRVLTFDFYGHGYSDIPSTSYNVHLYRNQFEELLNKLSLLEDHSNMILIGHSMGGLIANEFTAAHPDLVTNLILFNSAGLPVQTHFTNPLPFFFNNLVLLIRNTTLLDFAAHKLADLLSAAATKASFSYDQVCQSADYLDEDISGRHWVHNVLHNTPQLVVVDSTLRFGRALNFLIQSWLHQMEVSASRAQVLLSIVRNFPLLDADHSESLIKIKDTNVLIIWGEDDGLLPKSLSNDFKKYIPHAELVVIPKTDHAAFLQRPSLVWDRINEFLNPVIVV